MKKMQVTDMNNLFIGLGAMDLLLLLVASFITFLIWLLLSKILCRFKSMKQSERSAASESKIKLYCFFVIQTIMTLVIVFITVFNHNSYYTKDSITKNFVDENNNTVKLTCCFVDQTTNRFSSDRVTNSFIVYANKDGSAYYVHESFFFEDNVYVGKDNLTFLEESDGVRIKIEANNKTIKEIKLYYDDMEDSENAK